MTRGARYISGACKGALDEHLQSLERCCRLASEVKAHDAPPVRFERFDVAKRLCVFQRSEAVGFSGNQKIRRVVTRDLNK